MLTKRNALMFIALCVCAMLCFACGGEDGKSGESSGSASSAKTFQNLSFMGSYANRHPTPVKYWEPVFFKEAIKDTDGKLSFNYFASNTLYPDTEGFDAVNDGRVDFGVVRGSLFPGVMTLQGVIDLPGVSPNAIVGSLTAQAVLEEFESVRGEFPKNTVPFVAWSSAAYQLHTMKPVNKLADLKGMKIIVWDATTLEIAKALGANPVRMTSPDTYLALSKAMADGVLCPMAPVRSFKISEACKYHTMVSLGVSSFNMFVYKPLWEEFTPDIKEWLKAKGGMNMALQVGKSLEDGQKEDIEWMKGQGHTFIYLSDEDRAEFINALQGMTNDWLNQCKKQGFTDAEQVLKFAQEKSKEFTEEMRKGTYGDYQM